MLTYLTDTISVIDQTIKEMTPNTSSGVGRTAPSLRAKTVCSAYSGLVPMSPNTIPSAASIKAALLPRCSACAVPPLSAASGAAVSVALVAPLTVSPSGANLPAAAATSPDYYLDPHPMTDALLGSGRAACSGCTSSRRREAGPRLVQLDHPHAELVVEAARETLLIGT